MMVRVVRETWVQSHVESYQRIKKWYLMSPCFTLSIIRKRSRVKWSNPGQGIAPSTTHWYSSYRKWRLQVTVDYGCHLFIILIRRDNGYNNCLHLHHVVPPARISLTLSRHFSQSFIAFGRSSGLHPVSSHSYCMYVRAGRPAFAWPYADVHWSTSLMSSSLLFQQCPACLVRLTCIVFVMGGRWLYSWCLVGCCRQDLFNIALNILE